jgi:outer membrane protein assembly factor BamB
MYVISPEGESFGQEDPMISDRWYAQRGVTIFPVAIDKDGNVYVAYRSNATHPEAYTWDPPDEVDEDFFYNCVIFDPEGNKIGDFIPKNPRQTFYPAPTTGACISNSISISADNLVHYLGGGFGDFFIFALSDILAIERPKNFALVHYYTEFSQRRTNIIEKMIQACKWHFHLYRDIDSKEKRGPAFRRQTTPYPAITTDSVVWVRLTSKWSSGMQPRPSNMLLQLDSSRVKKHNELHWNHFKLPANIGASPIIDSNGIVYTGCNNGIVYALDSDGTILQTIEVGHPVLSLVIGIDESLIVVTKKGHVCLIQ